MEVSLHGHLFPKTSLKTRIQPVATGMFTIVSNRSRVTIKELVLLTPGLQEANIVSRSQTVYLQYSKVIGKGSGYGRKNKRMPAQTFKLAR